MPEKELQEKKKTDKTVKKTKKQHSSDESKITFEEAYEKLRQAAEEISDSDVTLERAAECYREGRRYYDICRSILNDAEQLIQVYDRENDLLKEFDINE